MSTPLGQLLSDDPIGVGDLAITGTPTGAKFLRDDGSWQSVISASDVFQTARHGFGTPAGATARITFPASTGLAAGIDFGGDLSATREAAGKLRVARPSGGATTLEVDAAANQNTILDFSEGGTSQWRVAHTPADDRLTFSRTAGGSNAIFSLHSNRQFRVGTVGTDTNPSILLAPSSAWDASLHTQRIGLTITNGWTNRSNGTRGDDPTVSGVLAAGATVLVTVNDDTVLNAKGAHVTFQSNLTTNKPSGTTVGVDNYSETVGIISRNVVTNGGGYAGNWESSLDAVATGDGGPGRFFGYMNVLKEANTYASYNASPIPSSGADSAWRTTGMRGIQLSSSGAQKVGTGILLAGSGGFQRYMVLWNTSSVEVTTFDQKGQLGFGIRSDQTNNTSGFSHRLNLSYDNTGAASTAAADGINFGGDVELYRSAADTLRLPDALSCATFISLNNANNSGFIQMSANAGGSPGVGGASTGRFYVRNGKFVVAYNNAGTAAYFSLDLTAASPTVTWTNHGTSAP